MRMRKNRGKYPKTPAKSRCRDCGRTATINRHAYFKAARPRCVACGGTMEYLGSWNGTQS